MILSRFVQELPPELKAALKPGITFHVIRRRQEYTNAAICGVMEPTGKTATIHSATLEVFRCMSCGYECDYSYYEDIYTAP